MEVVKVPEGKPIRILEWLVKIDDWIKYGKPVLIYRHIEDPSTGVKTKELQLKSKHVGRVKKLVLEKGQVATPGRILMELESCTHPVVMKDMCAECGQDLRLLEEGKVDKCARVAMVPNIPELKISSQQAEELGNQDKERLHKMRKLVLLVDLDQTLIHTTQNQAFASLCENNENFYIYNLNKNEPTLFTKLRPQCREFLEAISKIYELQIVTFGSRQYAHKIAEFIDPEKKYFAHRILSRDECFNPMRKSGNLRHLFPCGDSMVCIIDDRDDVWSGAPNLVLVKKYSYFPGAGDINSPDKLESKKLAADTAAKRAESSPSFKRRKIETKSEKVNKSGKEITDHSNLKETSLTTDMSEEKKHTLPADMSEEKEQPDKESNRCLQNVNETNDSESCTTPTAKSEVAEDSKHVETHKTNSNNEQKNILNEDENTREDTNNATDNHIADDSNSSSDADTTKTINTDKETSNNLKQDRIAECGDASNNGDTSEQTKDNPFILLPDADEYLLYLQHILTEIHSTYYEAYGKFLSKEFEHPPDLRGVMPFIRSKVLYGCYIVLTGIIPSNYKAPAEQHKAYIAAKQLGATIDENVSERTTHLIAGKKGTVKYQEAQKQGDVKLVSLDWLLACSERWERVSEDLFPIPKKRSNNSGRNSREGTPPVTKSVKWSSDSAVAKTYNPVTGKLIKKNLDPVHQLVAEAARQRDRQIPVQIYSSLEDPQVIVPLKVEVSSEPSTSTASPPAAGRTRKPSMAEMMGIEYSLSSSDLTEMGREVDDLLTSDEDEDTTDNNNLGTLIETVPSSSSEASSKNQTFVEEPITEKRKSDDSSSSSSEEFDHMAELLDHEMHYDEDSRDLDALD